MGAGFVFAQSPAGGDEYAKRVKQVTQPKGFVAFWDFVRREDGQGGKGRFQAHQPAGDSTDLRLDAGNYVLDYWGEGRAATYADLPVIGRGPFGQAVRFQPQKGNDFRPMLFVPRARLHNSGLDVKGAGGSVSMVVWMAREAGGHAVAGIWHEGTDLHSLSPTIRRVEKGMRQYCLFMGLAANPGASAAHISENGGPSFSDQFARNLSTTPDKIPNISASASAEEIDRGWSVAGFTFDNQKNQVTSYLNGVAKEYWIEQPEKHPFFQWPAKGWAQVERPQPGFPAGQTYRPPEGKPRKREVVSEDAAQRVELHHFEFTRVRVTLGKDGQGKFKKVLRRDLVALRANPFWFPHDIYSPKSEAEGGPFTIGEVIHSSRSQGFVGYLGGVAVYNRALSAGTMKKLAEVANRGPISVAEAGR